MVKKSKKSEVTKVDKKPNVKNSKVKAMIKTVAKLQKKKKVKEHFKSYMD